MALSHEAITVDGTQTDFVLPFDYIAKAHVKCKVNGIPATYSWLTPGTVRITPAPAAGSYVLFYRETSPGIRLVDYSTPGTLSEEDLDADSKQAFFLCQEAVDAANAAMVPDLADGQYSAQSKRIKNVATPIEDTDGVNKGFISPYVNTALQAASDSAASAVTAQNHENQAGIYKDQAGVSATNAHNSEVAAALSAATFKTTAEQTHAAPANALVDSDEFGFWDSVTLLLSKVTWANIKVAIFGTSNIWTAVQKTQPLSQSSTTFDVSAKQDFICTPTAAGTIAFTGIAAGYKGEILFINNSNYAMAKGANIKAPSSLFSTISATGRYRLAVSCLDGVNVDLTGSVALS